MFCIFSFEVVDIEVVSSCIIFEWYYFYVCYGSIGRVCIMCGYWD